jgi:hypothetical protein
MAILFEFQREFRLLLWSTSRPIASSLFPIALIQGYYKWFGGYEISEFSKWLRIQAWLCLQTARKLIRFIWRCSVSAPTVTLQTSRRHSNVRYVLYYPADVKAVFECSLCAPLVTLQTSTQHSSYSHVRRNCDTSTCKIRYRSSLLVALLILLSWIWRQTTSLRNTYQLCRATRRHIPEDHTVVRTSNPTHPDMFSSRTTEHLRYIKPGLNK